MADTRPGIPRMNSRLRRWRATRTRPVVNCGRCMTAAERRCAGLLMMRSTPGRMVAHHYAGRPEACYRYDDTGRVTEQVNPEGLDYRFEYGESRVIITDSLNRREVLYTEGEGGLKRVVKKEHADGSITRSEYDEAGRLKAQTDAAGRRTEYSLHMASGAVTAVTGPDGRTVRYGYNSQLGR